jgi:hypothetical protein
MRLCPLILPLLAPAAALGDPVMPTYTVVPYATVAHPAGIALSGVTPPTLYIGRHPDDPGTVLMVPSGGGTPVPATATPIPDPEGLSVDPYGRIAGYPPSVIVASGIGAGGAAGRLSSIRSDGVVTTLVESPLLNNADQMAFNRNGTVLYISAFGNGTIVRYTDYHALFTFIPALPGVTVDSLCAAYEYQVDNLVLGRSNGTIAIYRADEAGTLVDSTYATGVPTPVVVASPRTTDPVWGNDIYVFTGAGELRRYTAHGVYTTLGSGFGSILDAEFGPDGALYASSSAAGLIYRISCLDATLTIDSGYPDAGNSAVGCPSENHTFTVHASAAQEITYRWQVFTGGDGTGWTDLADGSFFVEGGGGVGVQTGTFAGTATSVLTFTAAPFAGNDAVPPTWYASIQCVVSTTCSTKALSTYLGIRSADIGKQGGLYGHDGLYDNNDFISFIDLFFAHDPRADMGAQGGIHGNDGLWDNNDFVSYIDTFFEHC